MITAVGAGDPGRCRTMRRFSSVHFRNKQAMQRLFWGQNKRMGRKCVARPVERETDYQAAEIRLCHYKDGDFDSYAADEAQRYIYIFRKISCKGLQ